MVVNDGVIYIYLSDDGKLTLKKLETLDLSFNSLNESIMELVGTLPSIKNLNLSGNSIRGRFMKGMNATYVSTITCFIIGDYACSNLLFFFFFSFF